MEYFDLRFQWLKVVINIKSALKYEFRLSKQIILPDTDSLSNPSANGCWVWLYIKFYRILIDHIRIYLDVLKM